MTEPLRRSTARLRGFGAARDAASIKLQGCGTDKKVICGDDSKKVTMLDAESGKMVWETELGGAVTSVDFSSTARKKVPDTSRTPTPSVP